MQKEVGNHMSETEKIKLVFLQTSVVDTVGFTQQHTMFSVRVIKSVFNFERQLQRYYNNQKDRIRSVHIRIYEPI